MEKCFTPLNTSRKKRKVIRNSNVDITWALQLRDHSEKHESDNWTAGLQSLLCQDLVGL